MKSWARGGAGGQMKMEYEPRKLLKRYKLLLAPCVLQQRGGCMNEAILRITYIEVYRGMEGT
jgi:hypothetical protein